MKEQKERIRKKIKCYSTHLTRNWKETRTRTLLHLSIDRIVIFSQKYRTMILARKTFSRWYYFCSRAKRIKDLCALTKKVRRRRDRVKTKVHVGDFFRNILIDLNIISKISLQKKQLVQEKIRWVKMSYLSDLCDLRYENQFALFYLLHFLVFNLQWFAKFFGIK